MIILGIESSCDETAASIVEDGRKVLSNIVSSQIKTHEKFGGVVPEVAAREHLNSINAVIKKAYDERISIPIRLMLLRQPSAPDLWDVCL